jgi:glycosyltransferase involved in cell wall biosynthesis
MGDYDNINYKYLNNINIYRTPQLIKKYIPLFSFLINYFYQVSHTINKIKSIMNKQNYRKIFVSIPQLQALIIGSKLKKIFPDIELTEEIRDLYSTNYLMSNKFIKQKILFIFEYNLMKRVDKFIFVTRLIKEEYVKYFSRCNNNIIKGKIILNGYDPEEYENLSNDNPINIDPGKIVLTYTGRLYGTRSIDNLIKAIGILANDNLINKEKLIINIIGDIDEINSRSINKLCIEYNLGKTVNILGVLSHKECIKYQSNATYNLLITHTVGSEYAIPSKLFEYSAVKRPIFAISDDILVKELIDKYKLGFYCKNNLDSLKELLLKLSINNKMKVNTNIPDEFKRTYQIEKITRFISEETI